MSRKGKTQNHLANKIELRPGENIGNNSAENDDEFLFSCFVDHPALSVVADITSSKHFVSARTGAGKTAILRMISKNNTNVSEVDLLELSLSYVANSDIIQFLSSIGVDLDLFFQVLWKHIFCIEYIRSRFSVTDANKSRSLFRRILDTFESDDRRKSALKYLAEWENKFFITMDENIKEVTQKIEKQVDTNLSVDLEKFKSKAGYARSLSQEKKSALVARAKKIVDSDLLADLGKVMDLLSTFDKEEKYKKQNHYILIDGIDEKWVDETIRYKLIRALIESLRSFRKIQNLKIIVAIRADVLERVIQETDFSGAQREKYDDYFLRVKWNKDQMFDLVNKRINFLFRKKYSSENVYYSDIFDPKVGSVDSFSYILDRTLYRPRDIISYLNICLKLCEGKSKVSQTVIRKAEEEYSRIRLQALVEEWNTALPYLQFVLEMHFKKVTFLTIRLLTKLFFP